LLFFRDAPAGGDIMRLALLVVPICFALGCSGVGRIDWSRPGRDMWQRPDDVIAALEIEPGARVADLGAGEGYFVSHLAEAVGYEGVVYAVEVDDERAQQLEEDFQIASNVVAVRGEFSDPRLPDGEIDLVLIVNTYHHIEDREQYFARLLADLTPTGRLAVVEPDCETSGFLELFVEEDHVSCSEVVERELRAAGYERVADHDILPVQLFEVFARRLPANAMR
jgi:arsenite methyltransferase